MLKLDLVSSFFVEPTGIAEDTHAGYPIPSQYPSFPADITTAIPADTKLSIIVFMAFPSQ